MSLICDEVYGERMNKAQQNKKKPFQEKPAKIWEIEYDPFI